MFMYVTFAVNAMRIFGNNRKIIGNNWTISQELWNRIIGKILSIIANFREVSDEEVIESAKAANIHNLITSLPKVVIIISAYRVQHTYDYFLFCVPYFS